MRGERVVGPQGGGAELRVVVERGEVGAVHADALAREQVGRDRLGAQRGPGTAKTVGALHRGA